MENLQSIHEYYKERLGEVKRYSKIGDVWVFLMCSTFIEYLVKLISGNENTGRKDYKNFIKEYLYKINPLYRDFEYASGKADLPDQMYHILRCGIVHGFSLIADEKAKKENGRDRSILIGHKSGQGDVLHLGLIKTDKYDAAFFCAEDFADDIEKVIDLIFQTAEQDKKLEHKILGWIKKYPPIAFLGEVKTEL